MRVLSPTSSAASSCRAGRVAPCPVSAAPLYLRCLQSALAWGSGPSPSQILSPEPCCSCPSGPCSSRHQHRPAPLSARCRATATPDAPAAPSASSSGGSSTCDPLAARLKSWVLQHSKALPTRLTPVRTPGGSYELVCEEPVQRGAVLVSVPRALLMSAHSAAASPHSGPLVASAGLTEWQALLLHLLCERALGQDSFWAPYLDTLPQDMSDHPLLWGPERLCWLAGSPLVGVLAERGAQVAGDCEALLVAGANDTQLAARHREATGHELVSETSVRWASCVLLSRSFSLDLAEEEGVEGDMSYWGTWSAHAPDTLALVPWADMLKHCPDAGPESCASYAFELGSVVCSAHREYAVGEAAADSHGQGLSPADLFLDYGVEDPGAPGQGQGQGQGGCERDRYDVDPAEVVSPRGPRNAALLRALAGVTGEGVRLALGPRGPDTASLTHLRAALAGDAELVRAGWRLRCGDGDVEAACRAMGSLATPASAATEGALLRALAAFIAAAQARFPTSLQEDEDRLAGRNGQQRVEGPERLAVSVVASQKRALAGSAEAVAGWLRRLEGGCGVEELYEGEEFEEEWGEEGEDWEEEDR